MSTLVALLAAGFLVWVVLQAPPLQRVVRKRARASRLARLRRRYLRLLGLPRARGEEVIDRQLAELAKRHPAKSPLWRMKKLLADIERARR